ncbi:hypothetical protein EXIGLDRAFT_767379 [Exidia glandulosa HHB12029]|nr:hypothetical protein EXIGLDRAFT_767379 [Exidia glandulosa HHB12029]
MTLSKSFPRLKEVHILFPRDVWPATEREAKQSSWPPIAEAFAKQSGTLLDHSGRSWRPRKTAQLKDFW